MYAIVIPYTRNEIPDLIFNLELWNKDNHLISDDADEKYNIDLVFYSHRERDEANERKILNSANLYINHFNSISFSYANLKPSEDTYPLGSGLMYFSYVLNNPQYEYIFYKETDCFPIKSNWLNKLHNQFVNCQENRLWVMGSLFSGEQTPFSEAYKILHINGNAIYATGNTDYKCFLEHIRENIDTNVNYDVEIFKYLFAPGNYRYLRNYMINSKYSDFILNFGRKDAGNIFNNIPQNTLFIHGKRIKEKYAREYGINSDN